MGYPPLDPTRRCCCKPVSLGCSPTAYGEFVTGIGADMNGGLAIIGNGAAVTWLTGTEAGECKFDGVGEEFEA